MYACSFLDIFSTPHPNHLSFSFNSLSDLFDHISLLGLPYHSMEYQERNTFGKGEYKLYFPCIFTHFTHFRPFFYHQMRLGSQLVIMKSLTAAAPVLPSCSPPSSSSSFPAKATPYTLKVISALVSPPQVIAGSLVL